MSLPVKPTNPSTSKPQRQVAKRTNEPDGPGREQKQSSDEEIKVFISHRNSTCDECGEELGKKAWITLAENKGALCLACADLDELVFLPAGDAAVTRRSKRYSNLSAVVLKFSKTRGRYERQGLLVDERARERRDELDEQYVNEFGKRIRALFPNCPAGRERVIAEHACLKFSGRVGRSAAAKKLDDEMVRLAVLAHVRHSETNYDQLLGSGWFRNEARKEVRTHMEEIAEKWQRQ